jgi:hypothetical protein
MTVRHSVVTVGTTATLLSDPAQDLATNKTHRIFIQNPSSGQNNTVYVGGEGVTSTSYGFTLGAGDFLEITMDSDEEIYAVVATGTELVSTLRFGQQ